MGLLQNISLRSAEPLYYLAAGGTAGVVAAASCVNRAFRNRPEQAMNMYVGVGDIDKKTGVPSGYSVPYQIKLPIKEGGMSSYAGIIGEGKSAVVSNLRMGINLLAQPTDPFPLTGHGEATSSSAFLCLMADIAHAVQFSGSGTISYALARCPL